MPSMTFKDRPTSDQDQLFLFVKDPICRLESRPEHLSRPAIVDKRLTVGASVRFYSFTELSYFPGFFAGPFGRGNFNINLDQTVAPRVPRAAAVSLMGDNDE
jgi:hypothetical protein